MGIIGTQIVVIDVRIVAIVLIVGGAGGEDLGGENGSITCGGSITATNTTDLTNHNHNENSGK